MPAPQRLASRLFRKKHQQRLRALPAPGRVSPFRSARAPNRPRFGVVPCPRWRMKPCSRLRSRTTASAIAWLCACIGGGGVGGESIVVKTIHAPEYCGMLGLFFTNGNLEKPLRAGAMVVEKRSCTGVLATHRKPPVQRAAVFSSVRNVSSRQKCGCRGGCARGERVHLR